MDSDLVLIGPNIPHLNFDYGLKTEYHQIVVQLKENFLGDAFQQTPEFQGIRQLFERARFGLSYSGEIKQKVAGQLKAMQNMDSFDQLLCLLEVFHLLAQSADVTELNDKDTSVKLFMNDKIRMGAVYNYIHANYNESPTVHEIASSVHLTTAAFCRYFKKQTKMTFTDFLNQYRIAQSKTLLLQDKTVSEAAYATGFESVPYYSKLFKKNCGTNPSEFKKIYAKPFRTM